MGAKMLADCWCNAKLFFSFISVCVCVCVLMQLDHSAF